MSVVVTHEEPIPAWFLERKALKSLGRAGRVQYQSNQPFPHAVFDDFLGAPRALELARHFPDPTHADWLRRDYREQAARLGQLQRTGFHGTSPVLRHCLAELSAMAFLDFLGALTGIDGLIADPHFRGAGPSLTLPGGHLSLHADFNRDRTRHLERKVTVLYYLSLNWQPEWGGALELWDEARTACVASYPPLLDRLIVLEHGDSHWHGHPQPLSCPEGHFRAVISSYYYVASPSPEEHESHGAIWAL